MSKTKKIISVVLAVALVMAMATVAMVSASAAGKVYFNQPEGWGALNAHMWSSVGGTTEWPGLPMTDEGNGVWSIEIGDEYDMIIINDGANQTADCAMPEAGMIGTLSSEIGEVGGSGGQANSIDWAPYADAPVETTVADETTAVEETTVATVETTAATVETTVATVETTVATVDEVETTVATADEVETTAATVETTVVTEPVETTAATVETTVATEPVETTVATVETTAATAETTAATVETTVATVETTAATVETTAATVETTAATVETTAATVETTVAGEVETTVAGEVETTVAAEADAIVVGGVEYTAQVGDIITYTANLTTPKNIENVQAFTTYDSSKLKLVDADAATRFPNMTGVVANAADGVVYFNASEISAGFDFTAGQTLIYLQFEVIDNTYSEIVTTIEEMVEFFGGDYVTGGEIVADGVSLVESLDVPVVDVEGDSTSSTATEEITTTAPVTEEKTDATSATEDEKKPAADVVPTGVAATIYVVLAVLAMAAAAVVVLRKKVNG